jgi:tight adherence protein B
MHDKNLKAASYIFIEILKLMLLLLFMAYLFFDSVLGLIILSPYAIYSIIMITKRLKLRRKEILILEFRDMLRCIQASMEAGTSIEKSLDEIEDDLIIMHGEDSIIVAELRIMKRKLELGENIENILLSFAEEINVREIINFAGIFSQAKRAGGNLLKLIRATCEDLYTKEELKRQIDEILSANRTECLIMKLMPLIIIMYFRLFSSSFLNVLYQTSLGRLIMLGVAIVYIILLEVSEKIIERIGA